jgi:hypothetical protein
VSSPFTRRVYNLGLNEFIAWFGQELRHGLTKGTANAWRMALEARGLGPLSMNVRITAVRELAVEAVDSGLLAPDVSTKRNSATERCRLTCRAPDDDDPRWRCLSEPDRIASQPSSGEEQPLSFDLDSSGSPAMSIQWRIHERSPGR